MLDRLILKVKPKSDSLFSIFKNNIELNLISAIKKRNWVNDGFLEKIYLLDVEFNLLVNAQKLWNFVNNNLVVIKNQINGEISCHKCSHYDSEVFSCKDDIKSEYRRIII